MVILIIKKILSAIWTFIKRFDKLSFLFCIALSAFSCILLHSMHQNGILSSDAYFKTQLFSSVIGACSCIFVSAFDYKLYARLWFLYTPLAIILVLLTFTSLGVEREGTGNRAWLDFFGLITFQPSEILKISVILTLSYHISKIGKRLNHPLHFLLVCIHGAVPVLLIAAQGDDGSALVFLFIFFFMMLAAGVSWKYIVPTLIAIPPGLAFMWFKVMRPHQKSRFLILFDPDLDPLGIGLQQRYGKIALGSGMLYGKGLYGSTYTYVPEIHNDFIFSYIGMTLGFIGCLATIVVIGFFCLKLILNSRLSKDMLGKLICIGVFAMIFFHSVVNIGMVLGVMPVIGIPLPFLSAGGTSIVTLYVSMGIAMSVYSHRQKSYYMFYNEKID